MAQPDGYIPPNIDDEFDDEDLAEENVFSGEIPEDVLLVTFLPNLFRFHSPLIHSLLARK